MYHTVLQSCRVRRLCREVQRAERQHAYKHEHGKQCGKQSFAYVCCFHKKAIPSLILQKFKLSALRDVGLRLLPLFYKAIDFI